MNQLSVIIPTLNEAGTIKQLIWRLHDVLAKNTIEYEIIAVDDHSTDGTQKIVQELVTVYPVQLLEKNGKRGKAYSLLEGFEKAQYPVIAMIDADLQYPPEVIPEMLSKLTGEVGIVVADRTFTTISNKRKFLMNLYRRLFGKYLHKFDCDVMSGLKVFKKEIFTQVSLHPMAWSFDIEFLIKARNAGYQIANVPIKFDRRLSGQSKIGLVTASTQMVGEALILSFIHPDIVPFTPEVEKKKGKGFYFRGMEFIHHSELSHHENAFFRLSVPQVFLLILLFIALIVGLLLNWHTTIVVLLAFLTFLYFADLLFNLFLIYRSFSKPPEIFVAHDEFSKIPDSSWPSYTIMCPLYKEWQVVPQFIDAMQKLDYPTDKLQILLLLEEDDHETIEKVSEFSLPSQFEVVVVPHSNPKTKPKALNYALYHARGEYAVIYDAEDVPDHNQLKKTIISFQKVDKKTICIQAKLNFYNPHQNILTRVFTAEYSLWFDLVLTGLQSINAPIPLGGTSNHFRVVDLKKIRGWDAFNVTEDCDLGIRLVKRGYRTAIVDSTTLEEANSSLPNWFRQRSRWIKGYMQTYLVHMRNPKEFITHWRDPRVITFQLVVGGKIMSMFINPTMWIITLIYFSMRSVFGEFIESFFPAPILYMGVFSLIFGNFLYLYYYMIGCAKREHYDLIKYAFLIPFYWLAMSIAAWMALYELLFRPHYWQKTKHGLHLKKDKLFIPVNQMLRPAYE